jgi:hypothetical protein
LSYQTSTFESEEGGLRVTLSQKVRPRVRGSPGPRADAGHRQPNGRCSRSGVEALFLRNSLDFPPGCACGGGGLSHCLRSPRGEACFKLFVLPDPRITAIRRLGVGFPTACVGRGPAPFNWRGHNLPGPSRWNWLGEMNKCSPHLKAYLYCPNLHAALGGLGPVRVALRPRSSRPSGPSHLQEHSPWLLKPRFPGALIPTAQWQRFSFSLNRALLH